MPASTPTAQSASLDYVEHLAEKPLRGERLSEAEGLLLLETAPLPILAQAADKFCHQLHPEDWRTYNIDRNINYTNICASKCHFCAFYRDPYNMEAYLVDEHTLDRKIEETLEQGGRQLLIQGGLHPLLRIEWYERFISYIRDKYPILHIHGLSPPEIVHISRISHVSITETLQRLRDAGLGSLPGGGAEILVDSVRKEISPAKANTQEWLEVARAWHEMGGSGTATMMFGHVETLANRITHLERIRQLQDETNGFTAFIPWVFQPTNTLLASKVTKAGSSDYLSMLALSRLYLDNISNIQVSWVTQGLEIAELGLSYGANDFGSLMIEENVVAAAGTSFTATLEEIQEAITNAGFLPKQRNVFYDLLS